MYDYNHFRTTKILLILSAMLVMFSMLTIAAFAQVPAQVDNFSLGGTFSQAGGDLNLGFLGGVPLEPINGHLAWFLQRDTSDGIVLSETLNAHIQGGVSKWGWELNLFSDALRDIDRELQQVEYGYFLQPPVLKLGAWNGIAGVGNAAQSREAVAAQTGLSGAELDAAVAGGTTLNWFGFVNLNHPGWDVDVSLKVLPRIDFSDAEVTGMVSTRFDLGKGFSFDVAYQSVYETERRKAFGTLMGALTWEHL